MALRLIAKTYWHGTQIRFREPIDGVTGRPVSLDTPDRARLHGIYWTPDGNPRPRAAVIAAHPRVDFSEHHAFPALLRAGFGCLGANLRSLNNDMDCLHERLLIDLATYMAWLREAGAEAIVLLGNSGGGSLFAFYQAQAATAPEQRIATTPGGRPSLLDRTEMPTGDAIVFMAAHAGQGLIMNEVIDPAVVDETDPLASDPTLDMYEPANGFRPPPQWSEYPSDFIARYRAAQLARVARIDELARDHILSAENAAARHGAEDFASLPEAEQRRILRAEAFEPVMLVYRTMANLKYTDRRLDPSNRDYGSLLSPRPDMMNLQRAGFARVVTPHGWLSTWSGLSSNANVLRNAGSIRIPALVINAGRDLEVHPETHSKAIHAALASADKSYWDFPDALHYFEDDEGETGNAQLNAVMSRLVPWLAERFPTE